MSHGKAFFVLIVSLLILVSGEISPAYAQAPIIDIEGGSAEINGDTLTITGGDNLVVNAIHFPGEVNIIAGNIGAIAALPPDFGRGPVIQTVPQPQLLLGLPQAIALAPLNTNISAVSAPVPDMNVGQIMGRELPNGPLQGVTPPNLILNETASANPVTGSPDTVLVNTESVHAASSMVVTAEGQIQLI